MLGTRWAHRDDHNQADLSDGQEGQEGTGCLVKSDSLHGLDHRPLGHSTNWVYEDGCSYSDIKFFEWRRKTQERRRTGINGTHWI